MTRNEFLAPFRPFFPIHFQYGYCTLSKLDDQGIDVHITAILDEETDKVACLITLFHGLPPDPASEGIRLQILQGNTILATLTTNRRGQAWFAPTDIPEKTELTVVLAE